MQATLDVHALDEPYLELAPYYAEHVRHQIVDKFGERSLLEDGLQVFTALNLEAQAFGRESIDRGLRELDKRQGYREPLANLNKGLRTRFRHEYHLSNRRLEAPEIL